jgi:hypothetical protein
LVRVKVDTTGRNNDLKAYMKLRTTISLLVLLGLATGLSEGKSRSMQRQGANALVLRGRVTSVKTEVLPGRLSAIVTVNLSIRFSNTGPNPVIMLAELAPLCVGEAITKTAVTPTHWPVPEGDNILLWDYRGPSDFGIGRWGALRSSLDQPKPPLDKVRILAPGESWTKEDFIVLHPRIEPEKFPTADGAAVLRDLEILSPVWLHLYCQTWPLNIEVRGPVDGPKTGRKLRKRWIKFGELRLDPIISEPISLEFPKQNANYGDGVGLR